MNAPFRRPSTQQLQSQFGPVLERIRSRSLQTELERLLLRDEVRWLADAGFTSVRVPLEHGGGGASVTQLFELLVLMAAANSNLTQILRHHFFQVEAAIQAHRTAPSQATENALRRIVQGEILGAAVTEPHGALLGQIGTRLVPSDDGSHFVLDGSKIYTTGVLYSDRVAVVAVDEQGLPVTAHVETARAGVTIHDDWNGFGQKLTATGRADFVNVRVEADELSRDWPPAGHGTGFHQLVLLSTLAGIVAAAEHDTVAALRARKRIPYSGTGELARHDPIVQELVGKLHSTSFTLASLTVSAARYLEEGWTAWEASDYDAVDTAETFRKAELQIFVAQVTGVELALWATTHALDTLGASSLAVEKGLDRHWRNARAVASHNPHVFKARVVGDNVLNGTPAPVFRPGSDIGEKPATQH